MKLLLDSDFLFALHVPDDPNHLKAREIFADLQPTDQLYISNLVIYESCTVLSYKISQQFSLQYLHDLSCVNYKKITFTEELEIKTFQLFHKQTKKGTSFIDCSNVVIKNTFSIDKILSFDEGYTKMLK